MVTINEYFPVTCISRADNSTFRFSGDNTFGLPPVFPLALAASSPAFVRSRMISLSYLANDEKY